MYRGFLHDVHTDLRVQWGVQMFEGKTQTRVQVPAEQTARPHQSTKRVRA